MAKDDLCIVQYRSYTGYHCIIANALVLAVFSDPFSIPNGDSRKILCTCRCCGQSGIGQIPPISAISIYLHFQQLEIAFVLFERICVPPQCCCTAMLFNDFPGIKPGQLFAG